MSISQLAAAVVALLALDQPDPALKIGDPAPPLAVSRWVKGDPVKTFDKDKLYVIEFWATWCGPCRESIPHLTAVQKAHKDRITVIGVSVAEEDQAKVEPFVRKMGERMGYAVAIDDVPAGDTRGQNGQMMKLWTTAAGQRGIPSAFIINQGRVAWIGHPNELDRPLEDVLARGWDFESAARARRQLKAVEDDASLEIGEAGWRRFQFTLGAGQVAKAMTYGSHLVDSIFKDQPFELKVIAYLIVDYAPKKDGAKPDLHLALKAARRACEITHNAEIQPLEVLARVYFALDDAAQALYTQQLAIALAGDDASDEMKKALEEYRKSAAH
jgi:thiol-disulfide isomerase/thioredoxin